MNKITTSSVNWTEWADGKKWYVVLRISFRSVRPLRRCYKPDVQVACCVQLWRHSHWQPTCRNVHLAVEWVLGRQGRFPLDSRTFCSSLMELNRTFEYDHQIQIRLFTKWWRCDPLGLRMRCRALEPQMSTDAPRCTEAPVRLTVSHTARDHPQQKLGIAWSLSPLWTASAAGNLCCCGLTG